jgi:DNA invertase Pin-like site-specific DNA recombinase
MARNGYARVSTGEQNPTAQQDRLLAAGCDPKLIFTDHGASGAKASRPEWDRCLAQLREGDTLVITKLDRAGRSVRNLLDVVEQLKDKGVGLEVLDQHVDTETSFGRMLFTVLAAVAEFERELIRERTRDGLAATTARGRQGGRKPKLSRGQVEAIRARRAAEPDISIAQIGKDFGVSRQTVYRALGMLSDDPRQSELAG